MAADRRSAVVTPERFTSGMTFEQYMAFIGTPENLAREAGWWRGPERMDWSGPLRTWYGGLRLHDHQVAAIRWLAAQPSGPAKNADLMNEFLRERDGRTYQSIPVVVFYTRGMEYPYHFTERPAIYHPDRLSGAMRASRSGETAEETWERFMREWAAMQRSPFFKVWAFAGIDEMLSGLYERIVLGRAANCE